MSLIYRMTCWVETIVITSIFIAISIVLHDPLSMKSVFPWIWFAPVLIALRYGLWPSQFSMVVLVLSYLVPSPAELYSAHCQLFILGGFVLSLVCSLYQTTWSKQVNQNQEISTYLQNRVQIISQAYKVVTLAYQRIEHAFISNPVSIRSTLYELSTLLGATDITEEQAVFTRFLNLLALNCSLEKASIFPVMHNQLILEPIARVGEIHSPDPKEYLITQCIEHKEMTYITSAELLKGGSSLYLIVAPFINQDGLITAILLIEEMPFLMLNEENIGLINLCIQYFCEGYPVKNVSLILDEFPHCPVFFANELQRLLNLEKKTHNDSALVALQFHNTPHKADYIFRIIQEIRGIDSYWEFNHDGEDYLLILMPFSSREGVESYRLRIEDTLSREFQISLNNDEIHFRANQLSSFETPLALINDLLRTKP